MLDDLFLQRSIVNAGKNTNGSADLKAIVTTDHALSDSDTRRASKRSPGWIYNIRQSAIGWDRRRVGNGIVNNILHERFDDAEGQRVGGVCASRRLVTRVGTQCQVEEVRDNERNEDACQRPQGRRCPEVAGQELRVIWKTDLVRIQTDCFDRGRVEGRLHFERVPLQSDGLNHQHKDVNGRHAARVFAHKFDRLLNIRLLPQLFGLSPRDLKRLIRDIGKLSRGRGYINLGSDPRYSA